MNCKLLIISVACIAFLIPPAHSLGNIQSAAAGVVHDMVSIGTKVLKAKGAAVVKAVSDIASIAITGAGLKVKALGTAASSIKGAMADGIIAVGGSIAKAGNTVAGGSSVIGSPAVVVKPEPTVVVKPNPTLVVKPNPTVVVKPNPTFVVNQPVVEVVEKAELKTPAVVEEDIVVPCEEEVVEVPVESYPLRSVQWEVRQPSSRVSIVNNKPGVWDLLRNAAESRVNGFYPQNVRNNVAYEIVETPPMFRAGPLVETFQIKK